MFCPNCGTDAGNSKFCPGCGSNLKPQNNKQSVIPGTMNIDTPPVQASSPTPPQSPQNSQQMKCPHCGSTKVMIEPVTETRTKGKGKTKGFGCIKAFLGFFLFNIPGLLCGLCGKGKSKHKSKTTASVRIVKICSNCGNQWEN